MRKPNLLITSFLEDQPSGARLTDDLPAHLRWLPPFELPNDEAVDVVGAGLYALAARFPQIPITQGQYTWYGDRAIGWPVRQLQVDGTGKAVGILQKEVKRTVQAAGGQMRIPQRPFLAGVLGGASPTETSRQIQPVEPEEGIALRSLYLVTNNFASGSLDRVILDRFDLQGPGHETPA